MAPVESIDDPEPASLAVPRLTVVTQMEGKKLIIAGIALFTLAAVVLAGIFFASTYLSPGPVEDTVQTSDTGDVQTPDLIVAQTPGDNGEQIPEETVEDTPPEAVEDTSAPIPDEATEPLPEDTPDTQPIEPEETTQEDTATPLPEENPDGAPDEISEENPEQWLESPIEDVQGDTSIDMQDMGVPPGPADSVDGPFLLHAFLNQTDGSCLVSLHLQPDTEPLDTDGFYIDIGCDGQVYEKAWTPQLVDWCNTDGDSLFEQEEILATVIDTVAKDIPQGKPLTIKVMKDGTELQNVTVVPSLM